MRIWFLGLLLPLTCFAGIQFEPKSLEEGREAAKKLNELIESYGWSAHVEQSIRGGGVTITFQLDSEHTSTLKLKDDERLGIKDEEFELIHSHTERKFKTNIVSKKEIVAALLTKGRTHKYASFEKLMEQVGIRQNIAKWNQSAYWKYPDGDPVFDKEHWTPDFDLQPGANLCKAVESLWLGEKSTEIGCRNALSAQVLQGHLDFYKNLEKKPDAVKEMELAAGSNPIGAADDKFCKTEENVPADNWVPGDWGYVRNPDQKSRQVSGQEGSNIMYIGGGKFGAYYRGNKNLSLEGCIERVYKWRGRSPRDGEMAELKKDTDEGGMLANVRRVPVTFGADTTTAPAHAELASAGAAPPQRRPTAPAAAGTPTTTAAPTSTPVPTLSLSDRDVREGQQALRTSQEIRTQLEQLPVTPPKPPEKTTEQKIKELEAAVAAHVARRANPPPPPPAPSPETARRIKELEAAMAANLAQTREREAAQAKKIRDLEAAVAANRARRSEPPPAPKPPPKRPRQDTDLKWEFDQLIFSYEPGRTQKDAYHMAMSADTAAGLIDLMVNQYELPHVYVPPRTSQYSSYSAEKRRSDELHRLSDQVSAQGRARRRAQGR